MTATTKSMGYALRSLYPGAFASYQGVVFRVTGPETGAMRGVADDSKLSREVYFKLRSTEAGKKLLLKATEKLQKQLLEESGRSISLDDLNVVVPKKIDLRFDETLDVVFCRDTNCGTLDRLSYFKLLPRDSMPYCRFCRSSRVQQAPVWTPQRRSYVKSTHAMLGDPTQQIVRNMGTAQIFCYYSRPGTKCLHPQGDGACVNDFVAKLGSLKMMDAQRPIDSLRRHNPHCPKKLDVPPQPLERPHRTATHWWKMDFPRESMTVPLQVSSVEEGEIQNAPEAVEANEVLQDLMPVIFNRDLVDFERSRFCLMRVLEMTYGYRAGNRFSGVSSYYLDGQDNNVMGRLTETQGFVLHLKPEIDKKIHALQERKYTKQTKEELKEIALHSIKHALLVLAPMKTGFEPDKFYGSYDSQGEGARVYVYDTDEGGNGGFAALMRTKTALYDMLKETAKRLTCPTRDCLHACKQCLFIKNCGNVNRKLNRHIVLSLELFPPDLSESW